MTNPDRIEGRGPGRLGRVASSRVLQRLSHASESARDVGRGLTAVAEFAVGVPVAIYAIPRLLKTVVEFPSGVQVDWLSVSDGNYQPATYDPGIRKLTVENGGTAIFRVGGVDGINGRVEDGKGPSQKHPKRKAGSLIQWGLGWDPDKPTYKVRELTGVRKIHGEKVDLEGIVKDKVVRATHSY